MFEKIKNLNKQEVSDSKKKNLKEKQKIWDKKKKDLEKAKDYFGEKIDENIKSAVTAFNLNDLPTSQSCEGHLEKGLPFPWLDVRAPHKPKQRFENEKQIFQNVARKYGFSYEEVKRSISSEGEIVEAINQAHNEAKEKASKNQEKEEYKEWRQENKKLEHKIRSLINEFYQNREAPNDVKIKIGIIGPGNVVRVYSGPKTQEKDSDQKNLKEKLKRRRKEIKAFSQFLKEKFFEN